MLLFHLFSCGNWIFVIPGISLQRDENVFHLGESLFGCCINMALRKSTKTNITLLPMIIILQLPRSQNIILPETIIM